MLDAVQPAPDAGAVNDFTLHPRLAKGCHALDRVSRCHVLLKDNALFPWLLIVPEVPGEIEDLHQLDEPRFAEITSLLRRVSQFVSDHFRPDKLNVACIGNQVRQMHLHIVGRSPDDPAWPGTVWAFDGKMPYTPPQVEAIRSAWLGRSPG